MKKTLILFFIAAAVVYAGPKAGKKDGPETGRYGGELKDEAGKPVIRYAVQTPSKLPEKKHLGLIICFHGAGGNENSLINRVANCLKSVKLAEQYLIVGAKSKGGGWNGKTDGGRVRKLIAWALQEYPVDPRRVYCIGHSSGGLMCGSWGLQAAQDLFAGVIISTGHYWRIGEAKNAAATRTEFYIFHGDKDRVHPVQLSRDARDDIKGKGYRVVYREIQGHGHGFGPVEVLNDSFLWAHALRHKKISMISEDLSWLAQFSDPRISKKLFARPDTYNQLVRIGGREAGAVILEALGHKSTGVRTAAAAACTRAVFSSEVLTKLSKLLEDKSSKVRQHAVEALARAADWGHADARLLLREIALDAERKANTRRTALHALGQSVTLALRGNFKDHDIIWQTLIEMLDDANPHLRKAAFEPLQKAVPEGFGYKIQYPAKIRGQFIDKWKEWYTGTVGPWPSSPSSGIAKN